MKAAGIICEYNPLHSGHIACMEETRRLLGPDSAVVCAMSGSFVQRGDLALVDKYARGRAAIESGADLVLELLLPWSVASAERFADGAVRTLAAAGLVDYLVFGSECADAGALMDLARTLEREDFSLLLKKELSTGVSFPAARQRAVEKCLGPEKAALLSTANNILGVEYCKAILRQGAAMVPLSILRQGTGHDGTLVEGGHPSASAIRSLLAAGERQRALSLMAPAMARVYEERERAHQAPVELRQCERAILARLRSMSEADFAALDEGNEGLYHRLYEASRRGRSVAEVIDLAKTKRYPHARLRRMVLWAYLGLTPQDFPTDIPYLRPLAANGRGRALLSRMRKTARVPILTKAAAVKHLSPQAQRVFEWERRAEDLYVLAYPDLSAAEGGRIWTQRPVMLP